MGASEIREIKVSERMTVPPRRNYWNFHREEPITHLQAMEAAIRLIHSHFGLPDHARMHIPVQVDDDDVLIVDYINQQMLKG